MLDLRNMLAKESITYNEYLPFKEELEVSLLQETVNKEVMVMKATWGQFSMDINILNFIGENL